MRDTGDVTMEWIVRRRYETGEFGNAHFRVTANIKALLVDTLRAAAPKAAIFRGAEAALWGIPVVIDDSLEANEWRLVDNRTDEVLHSGRWE